MIRWMCYPLRHSCCCPAVCVVLPGGCVLASWAAHDFYPVACWVVVGCVFPTVPSTRKSYRSSHLSLLALRRAPQEGRIDVHRKNRLAGPRGSKGSRERRLRGQRRPAPASSAHGDASGSRPQASSVQGGRRPLDERHPRGERRQPGERHPQGERWRSLTSATPGELRRASLSSAPPPLPLCRRPTHLAGGRERDS